MKEVLILESFVNNQWEEMGEIHFDEPLKSTFGTTKFIYNMEYYFKYAEHDGLKGFFSASTKLPLSLTDSNKKHWPSFLLDLMPQGHARSLVCKREGIIDNEGNNFLILKYGSGNPIGNLRIQNNKLNLFSQQKDLGFSIDDLIEKNENFLEHAEKLGAIVSGASGAQGVAPKFLINKGHDQRWYCDGALEDGQIEQSFIIKYPKGSSKEDKLILAAEKKYIGIAQHLGLNVFSPLGFKENTLFIPRFDRDYKTGHRLGVESLSSSYGHFQFGKREYLENYLDVICNNSSKAHDDMLEFVTRDFLNIVMGNTDNHGRNFALIKSSSTRIRLSPLYDFAPTVMDPEMIPRASKWIEEDYYIPNFEYLQEILLQKGIPHTQLKSFFKMWQVKLLSLKELFIKYNIDPEVIKKSTRKYDEFFDSYNFFIGKFYEN